MIKIKVHNGHRLFLGHQNGSKGGPNGVKLGKYANFRQFLSDNYIYSLRIEGNR